MSIYYHFRRDHESSSFQKLARNKWICRETFDFFLVINLLRVDVFQEKQGILQQIILCPSNKPKKTCTRPCDTNNLTQSLTGKYHHTETESLYCL